MDTDRKHDQRNASEAGPPARDKSGRFLPGRSGNSAGKPRNETAHLRAELAKAGPGIVAAVIEAATLGDMVACRLCLERLLPAIKPSAAPVRLDLPKGGGLTAHAAAILEHAAAGRVPPDVAGGLINAVASLARIAEIDALAERVAELERVTK